MITKQQQIYDTLHRLSVLSVENAELNTSFIHFLEKKYDQYSIDQNVETASLRINTLNFLFAEDDFYTHEDVK